MIRETDLVSYLPPYIQHYDKEVVAALRAEDPEFTLVWTAADQTLRNEFIETADEYGISRFEKLLGILPYKEDTLESRRARVFAHWFNFIPYTLRVLVLRLIQICGEGNFTLTKDFDHYRLGLELSLPYYGQIEDVENLIDEMLPQNMIFGDEEIQNRLTFELNTLISFAGAIQQIRTETIGMNNDKQLTGTAYLGGLVSTIQIEEVIN